MIIELIIMAMFLVTLTLTIVCKDEEFGFGIFTIMVGFFTIMVGFVILIGMIIAYSNPQIDDISIKIISLERDSATEGSFILGSWSIDTKQYYYAYVEENGGYRLMEIPLSSLDNNRGRVNTILYESDSIPRYERITTCERERNWYNWCGYCSAKYSVYVPKGTIIRQFKG